MVLPGEIGTKTENIDAGVLDYKMSVTILEVDTIDYVVDIKISTSPLVIAQPQYIGFNTNVVGFTLVISSNPSGITVTAEAWAWGH